MKYFITFVFCLSMTALFAQNRGINLIHNKSNDTTFLKENRRIKVKTADGHAIAGKFKIMNDSEIIIKNQVVSMDSIVFIRKASAFSTIIRPVSIGFGVIFIGSGIALTSVDAPSDSYGIANAIGIGFITIGLPLFIAPIPLQKHPNKKWKYEILNE